MATQKELEQIAYFATRSLKKGINELLKQGVNYREDQLYVESFHQDKKASKLIFNQAHCSCGTLVADKNRREGF